MPALATATSDRHRGRPFRGRLALAVVEDELPALLVVDARHRLWTPSVRDIANRREKSPGTIHGHVNRLRAARVLVYDAAGRQLVDTHRLAELQGRGPTTTTGGAEPADPPPPPSAPSRRARGPDESGGGGPPPPPRAEPAAALLAAIDALTTVIELRPDLANDVAPAIARLADVLAAEADPDGVVVSLDAKRRATARPARSEEARDRAPSDQEKESELGLSSTNQRDRSPSEQVDSPSLSHSPTARPSPIDKARARFPSRQDPRGEGEQAGARSDKRLLELLAPLDPHRTVSRIEGVADATARYSDEEVAHAVARVASLGTAAESPIGLLIDRASAGDPTYFCADPPAPPGKGGQAPTEYGLRGREAEEVAAVSDADRLARVTDYAEEQAIEELTARYGHEPDRLLAPALARFHDLRGRLSPSVDGQVDGQPSSDGPESTVPVAGQLCWGTSSTSRWIEPPATND